MHGRGRCVWQGACMAGEGVCMSGGHECMAGGVHVGGHA